MKKALLFGASGFIGSFLLHDLLKSPNYDQVFIVVRKTLGLSHPKLKEFIGDFQSLPELNEIFALDEVFITLGTTRSKTPNNQQYYQIDHDYPVKAASIAREKGGKSVFLVTAVGATINSRVFYLRTKGETERDIISMNFDHTYIFRPSMIMGKRKESRKFESLFIKVWALINPLLIGKALMKYRGITGEKIALSMINAAYAETKKVNILHWQEMSDLLNQ